MVELIIVLLLVGLLLPPFFSIYSSRLKTKRLETTQTHFSDASVAISRYYSENRRYPCPAKNALPVTDPEAGVGGDCGAALAVGACDRGLCKTAGGRDTDGVGGLDDVLIGGLPFRDLDLPYASTIDGHYGRMTYAVSSRLTNAVTFADDAGAISIVREDGTSRVDPPGSTHVAIVSHGKDGKGGFTSQGMASGSPCGAVAADSENCDNDSVFVESDMSTVEGSAGYNDDFVLYQIWTLTNLWDYATNDPNNIYNKNPGNVGVGTADPQQRLHVVGNIQADEFWSANICDETGAGCFNPKVIGGDPDDVANPGGMKCVGILAMRGIREGEPHCDQPLSGIPEFLCPAGEFVNKINADGTMECGPPP